MLHKRSGSVRSEQKKSLYKREFSRLFQILATDVPHFASLVVSRVEVSADNGICYLFFTSFGGRAAYDKAFSDLKLYKSSLRSALGRAIKSRYVPDLVFHYDCELEKQRELEALLDAVKDQSSSEDQVEAQEE